MTMTTERPSCPDPETVASFAEGRLPKSEQPAFFEHLRGCDACLAALTRANEAIHEDAVAVPSTQASPAVPWAWWAAAAAAAVLVLSIGWLRPWQSPVDRLVAASPRSARVIEPRLAGGFPWASYRGALRANGTAASDPARLRLAGAAADAVERGQSDPSAAAQHAAGVALVLMDDPLEAINRLRAATLRAGADAKAWSDLAAAEYAAAARLDRPSLYPEALGHADRALRIDPKLQEALFNRALTLERLGLLGEARKAWQAYLDADASSAWATEAREHLAHLSAVSDAQTFERDRTRLERAAIDGDRQTVAALVERHRERARTFGEAEYLGRWADAVQRHDDAAAAQWLTVARDIGNALVQLDGESLLHDAVDAVGRSGPALAEAHVVYRRGRMTYAQQKPGEAEADLRQAAQLFAAHGDPMALVARWYAANTRYDRRDVDSAHREIDALAAELETKPGYHALAAGVQWELALCRSAEGDSTGALTAFDAAAERYRQAGERSNLAAIENLRAAELDVLGRPDDAWSARIACLAEESRQRSGDRLARELTKASLALVRAGRGDAARSFIRIEESVERSLGSHGLLVYALTREAELDATLGDDDAAATAAAEAHVVASGLADATLRTRELAVADLAEGAAALRRDPLRARELLTRAIGPLTNVALWPSVAEAMLLRAGAAARLGDREAQAQDLDTGIEALARYRVSLGGRDAPGVYDTGTKLFAQAVRLHVASGDLARAFDCVERSRGARSAGLSALRQRLAGSGTAVLESFVAPPDVLTFTITEHGEAVTSRPLPQDGEAGLYDTLIRPSEPLLTSVRHLVIVPDPSLADVQYATLSGGGPPLIARMAVAIAPSAAALVREPPHAPGSVVAMALPTLAVALPECAAELADVARLYQRAATVPQATFAALREAAADVIHIAGHTTQGSGTEGAVMIFAAGERVPWSRVASMRFAGSPIVTLSACDSLRSNGRPDARTLSLGAGFLAAGARYVIGTLVPIADRDAHEMFCRIHRRLAAGVAPDEAVREAQLEDLARGGSAWRAIALLTDRIPT